MIFLVLKKKIVLGCSRLSKVPHSVMNCGLLKHVMYVICSDKVAALCENLSGFSNMEIEISKTDVSLKWLPAVVLGPQILI